MAGILDRLPSVLSENILTEWLDWTDVVRMDTAHCSSESFLSIVCSPQVVLNILPEDVSAEDSKHVMSWLAEKWIRSKYYKVESGVNLNRNYLNACGSSIAEISLTGLAANFADTANCVALFCLNVQSLYCTNCVVTASICGMLASCTSICHLQLDLSLADETLTAAAVQACSCPCLVSMILTCDEAKTDMKLLAAFITLSDNLERLSLEHYPCLQEEISIDHQRFRFVFFLCEPMPKLTSLALVPANLSRRSSLGAFAFDKFVALCPNLVNFDVSGCAKVNNFSIVQAAQQLQYLRRVSFAGTEINDGGLMALATHLHETLEEVYLNNCYSEITAAAINHLLSTCKLIGFGLPHCNDLENVDFLPFQHLIILRLGSHGIVENAMYIGQFCVNLQMLDLFVAGTSTALEVSQCVEGFLSQCTCLFAVNYTIEQYFMFPYPNPNPPTIPPETIDEWEVQYPDVTVTNDEDSQTFDVMNVDLARIARIALNKEIG